MGQRENIEKKDTFIFTDSSGRNVEIPRDIKRIVPSGWVTQMFITAVEPTLLCSLSVALTQEEKEFLPAMLQSLPITGPFYGQGVFNPEEIARINPDLIIDIGEPKPNIAKDMDEIYRITGVPIVHISADLGRTPEAFRTLGKLLSREEKSEAIASLCDQTLLKARTVLSKVGNNKTPIIFCTGPMGYNVLAKGSFHSEILDWLADNKAVIENPSTRATGNETNPEQIMLWNPQVIIFGPGSFYSKARNDPVWSRLSAIRNNTYYETPGEPYNWLCAPSSINRFPGILWLIKTLYPQHADYDMYKECAEFFRLFYGYNLTEQRYNQLVGER